MGLGLLEFVNRERSTFSVADNIEAITTQRRILEEGTRPRWKTGALGAAFGILALFSSLEEQTKQPEEEAAEARRSTPV